MTKEIICTVCPMGCHILVEGEGDQVTSITGYTCRRGEEYGRQEFSHPVRILTTTVKTDSKVHPLLPIRLHRLHEILRHVPRGRQNPKQPRQ